ncbi:MAG: acetylxylan esterase [Gammaproteobacteria bacterium]|nr:acetylxylan esterase [Gammaproteobacteria bacterium]
MSVIQFHHSFPFDPRYGYDLDRLLEVSAPEEPDDFVAFWRNLYATARQVDVQPALYEVDSRQDAWRLFDVEFFSLDRFRVRGWLVLPRHEPVERGAVIGHGYGGRDGPDWDIPIGRSAWLFPCARGLSRSATPAISADPNKHVLHGIQNRHAYLLGRCVADSLWCAATALGELVPAAAGHLDYLGISFGGGMGALGLAWDERFKRAHLNVPSFGNHPLRLQCPCVGSGEAVRGYHRRHADVLEVLRYYDGAAAARRVHIPVHVAAALFDPAVPPPGQYSIHNALGGPKQLFVLQSGHFDHAGTGAENQALRQELRTFFRQG